jgi:hypothetical protein
VLGYALANLSIYIYRAEHGSNCRDYNIGIILIYTSYTFYNIDVQNRVLQAAAKHESQPSEAEVLNPSPESMTPLNEKVDISEA